VVSFKKGGLSVKCHAWDRDLGGRDIDELLFDHFCKEFQGRHKLDIKSNAKASFKLRQQCQRIKKVGGEGEKLSNDFLFCRSVFGGEERGWL
jgi:heat shock protein 4